MQPSSRFVAFVISVAVLVLSGMIAACCNTCAPTTQGGGAMLTCEKPAAMRSPGWLELRDLTVHTDADKGPPSEPYIRGAWVGGFFDATGDVIGKVGEPPKGRSTTRGYLELRTRAFYRFDDKRTRLPPWIEGARDDDSGSFFPAGSVAWSGP